MLMSAQTPRIATLIWSALALTLSVACTPSEEAEDNQATKALYELFDQDWEFRLDENPIFATSVGDHRSNDRLTSVHYDDLERRYQHAGEMLAALAAIDREALSSEDQVNAEIFERQLWDQQKLFEFGEWQIPLNADSGFHIGFTRLPRSVPLKTEEDYQNYLSRLEAWPALVDQQIANMRAGTESEMVLPKVVLEGYDSTIDAHLVKDARDSVFWEPFERFPTSIEEGRHDELRRHGEDAVMNGAVEGYRRFSEFWKTEYLPATRDSIAAAELPNGREYYEQRVRFYTTLDITPEEVHQIGLDEVARIRAEMDAVIEEVGFEGSFSQFLEFLRTDERFYAKTPIELLRYASHLAKTMDGKLPSLFETLPRLPYTVEPVPDHMAPKYTTGRYVGAPEGSVRPGIYWVNTYALESRPLYNMAALTLHEAVPGHHLQNALAREQAGHPNFRRFSYISAFGEGWGLYSEWLGVEAGIYEDDPYSNFGRLTYEMWRACRLVVDTGMHALGWSRQQAMDYLAENTALPLHEIRTETDRYISWPGQALAYKMGEITIRRLRREAEGALGTSFDVRKFHDAVLEGGSVPLPVLERRIAEFIESSRE